MTEKLLITLTPTDYYFFGGEETFDDSSGTIRNYLVRSNPLPQQTALVGLLRHILLNNGRDIGDYSFRAEWPTNDFGDLQTISPIFLQKGEGDTRRFLLPATKLWLKNGQEITVAFQHAAGKGFTGNDLENVPTLEFFDSEKNKNVSYTAKERPGAYWTFLDDGTNVPAEFEWENNNPKTGRHNGGIFQSSLHIGIDKLSRMKPRSDAEKQSKPDDEAFYKQGFFCLAEDYRFAVVAEFDLAKDENPADFARMFNTTMSFGGENRSFIIRAEAWTDALRQKFEQQKAFPAHTDQRIVLTSDAFVDDPQQLLACCRFTAIGTKPFRNIRVNRTDYSARTFANLHRKKNPGLLHLFERGSVFFPKDGSAQKIIDLLTAPQHFREIGYNHFYTQNQPFTI